MKEYKFEIGKEKGIYKINDADVTQNILTEPLILPFGALIALYRNVSRFCYKECIGGQSIYGNVRDFPYLNAVLRDKEVQREACSRTFSFFQNDRRKDLYEMYQFILDGNTLKYYFPRHALLSFCNDIGKFLIHCDEPKIKIWADYVLNKMAEDVELDYELFKKWIFYVYPETPRCYYEVYFDAYDNIDEHLSLRQNVDLAHAYIIDHQFDYD